jgi:hypothetical protein
LKVAEHFLSDLGASGMEGTLFRVTVDATDSVIGNHMADLSWLSKFLDEHETLVEGGIILEI